MGLFSQGSGDGAVTRRTSALALGTVAATILLLGPAPGATAASLSGTVLAASRPVVGSTVELYAAGSTRATRLGAAPTNGGGAFKIAFTDPGGGAPLYVVATGGRPKARAAGVGRALRLMDVAGATGAPLASVQISEQTTVASAYAFAQFLVGKTVAGPSPGLPNAAATVANLVEPATAKVSFVLGNSPNGTATEALPLFNTLANVLASCTRGTPSTCRRLFALARPVRGAAPRNTLDAILDIAHAPGRNTAGLFRLQRPRTYGPALTSRPAAWTLALVYTDGGFDAPGRMAFDAAGNAWAGNNFEPPGTTAGLGVTVLSPTGRPILGSPLTGGGIKAVGFGTAIDQVGRVWLGNYVGNSVSLLDAQGHVLSPPGGYTANGQISKPQGLAVDRQGSIWIPNFAGTGGTSSVTIFRRGDPAVHQTVTGGGINLPFAIAIDSGGNAWVTNNSTSLTKIGSVTKLAPDGTPSSNSPISLRRARSPQGIAVDSADNLWVASLATSDVTQISNRGRVRNHAVAGRPGLWGVAVDGADQVWAAGFVHPSLIELCGRRRSCPPGTRTGDPISPVRSGFVSRALQHLTAVQVDQSGNVWVANNWSNGSPLSRFVGGNGLVQFIGLAAPVRAPLIGPPQRP